MIRRPPRSTQSRSSAASDVYKRQVSTQSTGFSHQTMVVGDLIKSIPAPFNKVIQAGGWVWVGYAAVRVVKSFLPLTEEEKAAQWFDMMDTDESKTVSKDEFVAQVSRSDLAGGVLKRAYDQGSFTALIDSITADGLAKADFVKAWGSLKRKMEADAAALKKM
eukprot:TRINITY_DN27377_c0_g1_i1.p1 TRINITY_DN27377_c0_g1~~TRINITY_DN27377_c0_g1_i1.p1  ORF type:complete len:163 (+),score=71.66 TRINITY_DN27377_c0_g1_i1:143-631(+)